MPVVKMSDVAKAVGVSLATVARVIHNNGYVSEESRKRVEVVIKQLGYVPNKMAQGLKNSRSNMFGHMVPISDVNSIFSMIGNAVDSAAGKIGYTVLTLVSQNNEEKERDHLDELIGNMVQGIIFTGSIALDTATLFRVANIGFPIVMIERPRNIPNVDQVLINNIEGAYTATKFFLEKGHRRIGYIGKVIDQKVEKDRFDGYCMALGEAGINVPNDIVKHMPEYEYSYGFDAARSIFETLSPPTAILIASDMFVAGALQYFYLRGLHVPEDVSIIGYDDTLSRLMAPPITTVAFPLDDIGDTTMKLLMERINDKRKVSKSVTLSPVFVDRGSVKDI
jgi:DNA-binding LacI/PurR family transcriptional regulator